MTYGLINVDSVVNSDGTVTGGLYGFKNRIINGGMQVNQRGGTISASGTVNTYGVDRFAMRTTSGSVVATMEQSTVAPANFYNSLLCTVTTADTSLTTGDLTVLFQRIEGVNVADLGWGTASAKSVTFSFQVRSSVTGTYGVGIQNNDGNRSYPSTYTINAANTWETKTIIIPGDTTGTWNLGTTSAALYVFFSLSAASNYQGTANAWAAADYRGTTGQVNWGATVGNTFYVTGVQLEVGSTATSFDFRPYGTELALCQRYFWNRVATGAENPGICNLSLWTTTSTYGNIPFPVSMRTDPTFSYSSLSHFTTFVSGATYTPTSISSGASTNNATPTGSEINFAHGVSVGTGGQAGFSRINIVGGYFSYSAEL